MDSSKKTLLVLVAAFLAPIVLGTFFFFNMDRLGITPGTVNYGKLVQPVFPLKVKGLFQSYKPAEGDKTLTKKWTMLYLAPDECHQSCQDRLLLMYRVRLLMNEHMRRVRTLMVSNTPTPDETLREKYKDLVYTNVQTEKSPFLAQFPHREAFPIYLIDPLGNLMMYYPQKHPDAKKMIKDLHRLLKYSHLG